MFSLHLWLILLYGAIEYVVARSTKCYEHLSCHNQSIKTQSSDIECFGYRGCENGRLTMTTNNGDSSIYCEGSFSCYQALINITDTSGDDNLDYNNDVLCHGLLSCDSSNIVNDNGYIYCYGEQSCSNATLTTTYSGSFPGRVYCDGDNSCSNSIITIGDTGYFRGNRAIENSIIYSDKSNQDGVFYLYGFSSGNNATIICNSGETCKIHCISNGCSNLTTKCFNVNSNSFDDTACDIEIECQGAEYDEINCPNVPQKPSDIAHITIPLLLNESLTTYKTSFIACDYNSSNDHNSIVICDDYMDEQCTPHKTLETALGSNINNTSPICCIGKESCTTATYIEVAIIGDNDKQTGAPVVGIRCDGASSCSDIMAGGSIASKSSSINIYLTGYQSGRQGVNNVDTLIGGINVTNNISSDIFCTARESCRYQSLLNGKNLYCTAKYSCSDGTLISNFENIFAYASKSMPNVNLVKNITNIYCGGLSSCENIVINTIFNNVYASGEQALYESIVENVNNSVIGVGYQVLANSIINNTDSVYCISDNSCENATIHGIGTKIIANGNDSLSGSNISSNTNNGVGGTLTINITGTMHDQFDIYCTHNDTCHIYCLSHQSCTNLNLHCEPNTTCTKYYIFSDNGNDPFTEKFILQIVICAAVGLVIIMITVGFAAANRCNQNAEKKKIDRLINVWIAFLRASNLWADIVFCCILFVEDNDSVLLLCSFVFSVVHHLCLCLVSVIWCKTTYNQSKLECAFWQGASKSSHAVGISRGCCCVEFESDYYKTASKWQQLRVMYILILRNIPQLVLQIIYIIQINDNNNNNNNIINNIEATFVILASLFSFLSIIYCGYQVLKQRCTIFNRHNTESKNYKQRQNIKNELGTSLLSDFENSQEIDESPVAAVVDANPKNSLSVNVGGARKVSQVPDACFVDNALVVMLGIGTYDKNKRLKLESLPGVEKDYDNILTTFVQTWKYTAFYKTDKNELTYSNDIKRIKKTNNYKLHWTRNEIEQFSNEAKIHLSKHDALIFVISGHGTTNQKIYDSECRAFSLKNELFEEFSGSTENIDKNIRDCDRRRISEVLLAIPKIFCIECCRGENKILVPVDVPTNTVNRGSIDLASMTPNTPYSHESDVSIPKIELDDEKEQQEDQKMMSREQADSFSTTLSNYCKIWANVEGFSVRESANGGLFLRNVAKVFGDPEFIEKNALTNIILKIRDYTKRSATHLGYGSTELVEHQSTLDGPVEFRVNTREISPPERK